jgi:hypothetical protein
MAGAGYTNTRLRQPWRAAAKRGRGVIESRYIARR